MLPLNVKTALGGEMYRFAFDIGTASIGWAVYALDAGRRPESLERLGVRIFPTGLKPKSRESNAAGRRGPRQQRRQIDRRISRRKQLLERLIEFGLPPAENRRALFDLDSYTIRARAAHERVGLHELARAIWHISKHRGFKSNRKADRSDDESGKIASAAAELKQRLESGGYPTYGSWLGARHAQGEPVRIRPQDKGANLAYEFYPVRAMLEAEFDHIWRVQAGFHPELTDRARDRIRDTVFWQRPLRPVDPGRCTFFPDQPRLSRWHPIAQEFLILQQINSLRLLDGRGEQMLDREARDLVARHLMGAKKLTWIGLRRQLNLLRDTEINLEKARLKELAFNTVAARMQGTTKKPGPLAGDWPDMGEEKRLALLRILDESQDPAETVERLVTQIGLARDIAIHVEKIPLPDGHLRLCERAARAILCALREEVIPYSMAVERASLHHSDLRGDEVYGHLPPYNRDGRRRRPHYRQ